ncbi:MAG: adenylyl-sulfate kinase, partial [Bacteroidales bacterium]|nr:adenylyl-sulfate kinase [Bacteroidales bacterium]
LTHNTSAVGMIIDKLGSDKLASRITDMDRARIREGQSLISAKERENRFKQKGATIWITGLHGSGKNDLAYSLERRLFELGSTAILLDGSTVRSGLSRELDYSLADQAEHLRRVAHMANILNDQGIIAICSFISPVENIRNQISEIIGKERFVLVYMDADIELCKKNKPELYQLAEEGKAFNMPGVDTVYEPPVEPNIKLNLDESRLNKELIVDYLKKVSILA